MVFSIKRKKLVANLIKIAIGLFCFIIVYSKIKGEFTEEKMQLLAHTAFSNRGLWCIALCIILIPVNWGIESYKWMLITEPVQKLSYQQATKSVYCGVCLGNLAPGRATEFIAKILFFDVDNRPKITALHFLNGLFQLSITILAGLISLLFQMNRFGNNSTWMIYATSSIGLLIIIALILSIYKLDWILNFVSKKISQQNKLADFHYRFSTKLIIQLFSFSLIRYLVFFMQFILIISMLHEAWLPFSVFMSMALYFLITTTIPMFSAIEPAIRAAIALIVFKDSGIDNSALAISSILIWLVNIIFPSLLGYYFLLKQQFNFKFLSTKV